MGKLSNIAYLHCCEGLNLVTGVELGLQVEHIHTEEPADICISKHPRYEELQDREVTQVWGNAEGGVVIRVQATSEEQAVYDQAQEDYCNGDNEALRNAYHKLYGSNENYREW